MADGDVIAVLDRDEIVVRTAARLTAACRVYRGGALQVSSRITLRQALRSALPGHPAEAERKES